MKFSAVIGQQELKARLAAGIDAGRVSHAQLFTGEAGYGTLPLALAYAQYVNCLHRNGGDSCGECANCRQIEALAHPDLHFVFPVNRQGKKSGEAMLSDNFLLPWRAAVGETGGYLDEQMWAERLDLGRTLRPSIAANEAGEIIRKLSFKSFEGEYKILLIWLPEAMGEQAANKLLKILEEPWEKTLFLLVSQHPSRLLATIRSRTQQLAVPPVEAPELAAWLVAQRSLEPERAAQIARLAAGNLLTAQRLLTAQQEEGAGENFTLFASLMRLSYNDRHLDLMEWAESFAPMTRERQRSFLEYACRMLRESYMLHAGLPALSYLWGEEADFCRKFSPFIGNHNIEALVSQIESAAQQVAQNGNALIVFTHFALSVSKLIVRI